MRKSRFSESQIVSILNGAEGMASVPCSYHWKSKHVGLEAFDLRRLRELEDENNRLTKLYADMALENRAIKDLLRKL